MSHRSINNAKRQAAKMSNNSSAAYGSISRNSGFGTSNSNKKEYVTRLLKQKQLGSK